VIHVMQEMYDWYMDNLFGEHYKQAVKHAEKDGRDRRKRIAKGGGGPSRKPTVTVWADVAPTSANLYRMATHAYDGNYSGRSKWERIGSPLTASVVDWGIIINPYTPPRMKWKAVSRQYDRYVEYSN